MPDRRRADQQAARRLFYGSASSHRHKNTPIRSIRFGWGRLFGAGSAALILFRRVILTDQVAHIGIVHDRALAHGADRLQKLVHCLWPPFRFDFWMVSIIRGLSGENKAIFEQIAQK